ncbi:MAG: hypothetical protein ACYC6F_03460 [Longimicrobiales bacterium]
MIAPSRIRASPTRGAAFLALLCSASLSCGGTASESDGYPRTIEAGEFVFLAHEGVTDADVAGILEALRSSAERIEGHLRVTAMPRVRVSVWAQSHRDGWNRAMEAATGQLFPGATGYTPANDEMRLLLNPASPLESVHEYAHLVSWQVNPTIPNNPRWLWEAVAVFEAGSAPDVRTWSDAELRFPGLQALNQYDSPLPYRWGFHVAQAVIARWGDDGYVSLIRTNGDLRGSLGITEAAFGAYVEEFVRGVAGHR